MGIAVDFDIYNFRLCLFYNIKNSIFKLMMTIESRILLKNHVSCNLMLKYYITILLRQFPKTLDQFLDLPRGNENFEIYMPVLIVKQSILYQSSFEVLFLGSALIYRSYLKNIKTGTTLKPTVYEYICFK